MEETDVLRIIRLECPDDEIPIPICIPIFVVEEAIEDIDAFRLELDSPGGFMDVWEVADMERPCR